MGIQAAPKFGARTEFELKPTLSPPAIFANHITVPELQPLRAIGCLLVFAVHSAVTFFPSLLPGSVARSGFEYLPHAVVGFFMLSGLVLALPFVGENARRFSLSSYYYQRFLRLYPLYWLSVLFALAIRFAVVRSVGLSAISPWPQRLWSTPVTPGLLFVQFAGLSDAAKSINPAYWTLALEIQACLLFPLIIILLRRTRHWIVAALSIAAFIVATHYSPNLHLVRTLSYFFIGAYVARYYQSLKRWLQGLNPVLPCAALGLLVAFLWIAPRSSLLFRISFPIFNLALALLMVAVQAFRPLAYLARWAPVQRMADISYCFYLFHFPVLAACVFVIEPRIHSPLLSILVGLSISILVAWAAWRFGERPIRAWAKRRSPASRTSDLKNLLGSQQAAGL